MHANTGLKLSYTEVPHLKGKSAENTVCLSRIIAIPIIAKPSDKFITFWDTGISQNYWDCIYVPHL